MAFSDEKAKAKETIRGLVDRYTRDKSKWQTKNESETRSLFLDSVMKSLGWDFNSPDEVRMELKVQDEDRRKKIDYVFLLNGIEKLVVEAKAIKEDISRDDFIRQAIEYAYNLSCNWTVLTNFTGIKIFYVGEEGAIFRDIDLSNIERFDENFENLWLISRESFLKGTIDRKAEDEGRKRRAVSIDQDLLQSLNDWRERIYRDIKFDYAKKYSDDVIEEIVQKIIDRLIFIRKIEDMQGKRVLLPLVRQDPPNMYKELKKIFEQFNDDYNSKLFGETSEDLHDADIINLSNTTLRKVIEGMYRPSGRNVEYNFAIIDADVLGNIYEQYLGHILKRKKIVEGKTHRREQGIYYTPTHIVDYIVKNTIGQLLKDKRIDRNKIRVLDPACGSGSFLIKAYDHLLGYRKMKEGSDSQTALDFEEGITFSRKTQIVKENIFGVDLDPKAAEIAQLNLLMKIAESKERLPTLKNNIQVGNSLIDDDQLSTRAFGWDEQTINQESGFDVVIGNPPYINAIQLKKTYGNKVKAYWKKKYKSAAGTYDIYILFFEQALSVCRDGGYVSFITPNKYLSAPYGEAFRSHGMKYVKPTLDISSKVVSDNRRKLYKTPKIIFAKLALRPEAFLDSDGKYASAATNCVYNPEEGYHLKYLIAVLNSKLMAFIYSELFSGLKMRGGYFQFQAPQLRILPIVNCSDRDKNTLATLVDKIIFLDNKSRELGNVRTDEKARVQERIKKVDQDIDELIYKIYGINEDEKKIIESQT